MWRWSSRRWSSAHRYDRADAVVAILIAVFIVPRSLRLLREAVDVLLESTPRGVDLVEVRKMLGTPDVMDVHNLHAWTNTSGPPVLSAHVVIEKGTITVRRGTRPAHT